MFENGKNSITYLHGLFNFSIIFNYTWIGFDCTSDDFIDWFQFSSNYCFLSSIVAILFPSLAYFTWFNALFYYGMKLKRHKNDCIYELYIYGLFCVDVCTTALFPFCCVTLQMCVNCHCWLIGTALLKIFNARTMTHHHGPYIRQLISLWFRILLIWDLDEIHFSKI